MNPRDVSFLLLLAPLAPLLGCSGGGEESGPTEDVRVDHAGEDDSSEATVPRTCLVDGVLYVAWQEDRTGRPGIWFNVSKDGGNSWLPSDIQLNHGEADAVAPDIACVGENVYVAWEDERDGELKNHNIYAAVSTDSGNTFGEEDILLDGDIEGDAMSLGPRVAAAGDDVYVAWFDNANGAYDILVQASHNNGTRWLDTPSRADSDGEGSAYSAWPTIGASADAVIVAWEDSRNEGNDVFASASDDGGETFGNDQRLDLGDDGGASNSFEPRIVVDGAMAAVAWYDERNGARDILMNATTDAGGSWLGEAVRVDTDPAGEAESLHPALAAQDGKVFVTWQDARSGGYDIYERVYDSAAGDFASEEVRLDTDADGEAQSYYPKIAVDGQNIFVDWQDYREDSGAVGFNDLRYNYSANGGQNWNGSDLRINSNEPGSSYAINASAGIIGDSFTVVWADGRKGTGDIYGAKRKLGDESVYVAPKKDEE